MKVTSKITRSVLFAAILACLIGVGSGSAFAQEVFRNIKTQIFTNTCTKGIDCSSWGESVSFDEPATLEPVVVIWSARYFVSTPDVYYVGLMVNGGDCLTATSSAAYGPFTLADIATKPAGHFLTATFQWIVEPSDGVLLGGTKNTFELCGGGGGTVAGDSISIAQNTLSVRP